MCISNKSRAAEGPPLEALFKGGEGIRRSCEDFMLATPLFQQPGVAMRVNVSDSGSYRLEHVLEWLETALCRRSSADDGRWRILMCDAYRAHLQEALVRLAWRQKYVVVFVGGGATGVVQVNDTHLHGPLSAAYVELEQADMFYKLHSNPDGCPTRSREACLRDLALAWKRGNMHLRSSEGFLQNMLTNALDGSEDHVASSEVAAFWRELAMGRFREQCMDKVCQEYEAQPLDWSYEIVHGLVEEFPLTGHMDCYDFFQEDEGDEPGADGMPAWNDREGPSPAESDDDAAPAGLHEDGHRAAAALALLDNAQQEEVRRVENRLSALDVAAEAARDEPQLARAVAALREQVLRQGAGRDQRDSQVAQAVRRQERLARDLDQQRLAQAAEARRDAEAREFACQALLARLEDKVRELFERDQRSGNDVAEKSRRSSADRAEQDVARARREAIQAAVRSFRLDDLGLGLRNLGGIKSQSNRIQLVERVFALGDARPPEMEANWKRWLDRFDRRGRQEWRERWPTKLRNIMVEVLSAMEDGRADAALRRHRRITREWHLEF